MKTDTRTVIDSEKKLKSEMSETIICNILYWHKVHNENQPLFTWSFIERLKLVSRTNQANKLKKNAQTERWVPN